jgi:hypothetical protein
VHDGRGGGADKDEGEHAAEGMSSLVESGDLFVQASAWTESERK